MNTKRFLCAALGAVCYFAFLQAQVRTEQTFEKGWKFTREDNAEFANPGYNDSKWQNVTVPHDWAIYGPFSINNDKQEMAITQDGQTEAMEHAGRTGGLPFVGTGWYRLNFDAPGFEKGKKATLIFDGAMSHARVYVNGQEAGYWPYGYNSFYVDATPYLKLGERNELAVRLENEPESSRWYPGAGLYRNVHLVINEDTHIPAWGTYVTTPVVTDKYAKVSLKTSLVSPEGANKDNYRIVTQIKDKNGKVVATGENKLSVFDNALFEQEFAVANPELWSPDTPVLYTAESKVYEGNTLKDEYTTRFGIRTLEIVPGKGFFLNGKLTKFKGVCNHHDLGPLGGAVNDAAIRRQIRILKDMGCNAIRTSHNMPTPELVALCDEMGFMMMIEPFDEWDIAKCENGYHRYFNEWAERDMVNMLHNYRNNPCVIMWSIGNEVLEQWSDAKADTLSLEEANLILNFGHSPDMLAREGEESVNSLLTKKLVDFVKELDATRPVTAGCNEPNSRNHLFRSGALDVIGYNYHNKDIPNVPANFPDKPFIITESNSALMTRGYYRMPSDRMFIWPERWDKPFVDSTFACSSYENCHVPWGNTHEESLKLVRDNDFISGQYVWTGFDYIGEPTPYGWPARSSYFGIVDLAGFPKDVYYLYQSEWTDKQVLHLFPHWNWTSGQEIDMWCYYNQADEVELFVNGKSQGVKCKDIDNLHVVWRVRFEPGMVKVVARKDGKVVAGKEICTAGKPAEIRLTPDRSVLTADGKDLCFVTVEVLDEKGNLCPNADNLVNFTVKGNGFIAGVDNGNPVSMERFKDEKRKAFYGKCLVVIQNDGKPRKAELTATSEGLRQAVVKISAKEL